MAKYIGKPDKLEMILDSITIEFELEQEQRLKENIQTIRAMLPEIDNYNEYCAFIEGTGLTEEEYWNIKLEEQKMELANNKEE